MHKKNALRNMIVINYDRMVRIVYSIFFPFNFFMHRYSFDQLTRMIKPISVFAFLLIFFILLGAGSVFAQDKSIDQYIEDLNSKEDQVIIVSATQLGEKKATKSIPQLINVAQNHKSPKVKIAVIGALSLMETKEEPTNSLAEIIKTSDNNSVVYAALLAVGNLKDITNPNLKEILDFCAEKKSDDPFIYDLVQRVQKLIQK